MAKHHPDDNMLAEYAAGSLDWGMSLAVSAHLHFCSSCRHQASALNSLGGYLLSESDQKALSQDAFKRLMDRINTTEDTETSDSPAACVEVQTEGAPLTTADGRNGTRRVAEAAETESQPHKVRDALLEGLPRVIDKLVPRSRKLKWQFVSPHLKMARLKTGQQKYEVAFHRISTGGKVAEHGHKGLEVTLVLKGSFSDGDGVYNPGDFLVRQQGDVHRPTAAQNQDCLCLSVVEAPVALTGLMGKFINPFLSVQPG